MKTIALAVVLVPLTAAAAPRDKKKDDVAWLGEEMPLPLTVKTPQDLALKAVAERQYLIFNLIAGGKIAWDAGDFATAAARWETLLGVPGLDPEVDRAIRPLAVDARTRAGGQAALPPPPTATITKATETEPARPTAGTVSVGGSVSGGGALGPGGTVIWLRRIDGETPRPAPTRGKSMNQKNKAFAPRVLAVTVGSKVAFKNDDDIFHNVFSLSEPNDFDAGLYKSPNAYQQAFRKAGPVQLLCNIHSSMMGWIYVVDTPWYAQSDASGAFSIKGVPPGEYDIEAWHEGSEKTAKERITVPVGGARGIALRVSGDRKPPTFVPDKYGKPRQSQLGY